MKWNATVLSALLGALLGATAAVGAAPPAPGAPLDTVTVHGAREPEKLKAQIGVFVNAITLSSSSDSLARWYVPVCPLVAGLSHDKAEYFLQRISDVARAARVPLAREKCA